MLMKKLRLPIIHKLYIKLLNSWAGLGSVLQSIAIFSILSSCTTARIPQELIPPSPREEVQMTAPEPLFAFQNALPNTSSDYQLGTGDEITVEVWGYPELSGKHIIGPDGKISLPLVGGFSVMDLTRERSAQLIKTALENYYERISVVIRVDRYAANRILVLGRVKRPGEVQFNMTAPTLLEAISLAGGFAESAGSEGANTLPLTRCAIFRGREQIIWIELEPLFLGKDLSLNLKLQRNDIVYIPELAERLVYVLGEVHRPGAYRLNPNVSFLEILAKAGGPTIDAAPNRIQMIRPSQNLNYSLNLDKLMAPREQFNFALKEGDVIYVPTNTIAKVNYALRFLTPFSSLLGIYADIESIRADKQRRQLDQTEEELRAEQAAVEAEKAANAGLE